MIPYQENLLHYNWHWWYNFGNGDAGSRGVHQLDIALWGLNLKTYPTRSADSARSCISTTTSSIPTRTT